MNELKETILSELEASLAAEYEPHEVAVMMKAASVAFDTELENIEELTKEAGVNPYTGAPSGSGSSSGYGPLGGGRPSGRGPTNQTAAGSGTGQPPQTMGSHFMKSLVGGLGGAVAAGLGGAALIGLSAARNNVDVSKKYAQYKEALRIVKSRSDVVEKADPSRVEELGDTIFKFAPNVATDPNILQTVLTTYVLDSHGIDPQTIRSLVELEEKHKNLNEFRPSSIAFK